MIEKLDFEKQYQYLIQTTPDPEQKETELESKFKNKLSSVNFEISDKIGSRFLNKTIENYEPKSKICEKIKQKVSDFIDDIAVNIKSGRSFIFYGNKGNGKTHLASAIFQAARMLDITTEYRLSREITREIKESWQTEQKPESKIIQYYSGVSLLIIDEIGLDYGSETNLNIISEIFDNRYRKMKSTILIGNIENKDQFLKHIGSRIESRMNEIGEVLFFDEEDHRKAKK